METKMRLLSVVLLCAAGTSLQAWHHSSGFGSSFGGAMVGSTMGTVIGNSMSRPTETVYVERDSSDYSGTNRRIQSLQNDLRDANNTIDEKDTTIRDLRRIITKLEEKVDDLSS